MVDECHAAGIRIVLVTGDHPATARVVADELGILGAEGRVLEGDAVARGEHVDQVETIDVYARVRPEQKVGIVDAWQAHGDVVAMTGDGVNDAPALRRADIGVAMGRRGTEVARQAADLVLLDDDLHTLVVAVGEGRRIHANIRTFLRYGLGGGLAEIVVLLAAPLLGLPIPLTPAMILWINMVTHGLPGVAFGGEPLDPGLMSRPSPPPQRSVLDRGLVGQILAAGALVSVASLAAGLLASHQGEHVRTAVFLTLGLGQLAVALALRAPRTGWDWRERGLEVAVLLAGACQLAGVAVPGLRDLLGTEPVALATALMLFALAALPGVVDRGSSVDLGPGPQWPWALPPSGPDETWTHEECRGTWRRCAVGPGGGCRPGGHGRVCRVRRGPVHGSRPHGRHAPQMGRGRDSGTALRALDGRDEADYLITMVAHHREAIVASAHAGPVRTPGAARSRSHDPPDPVGGGPHDGALDRPVVPDGSPRRGLPADDERPVVAVRERPRQDLPDRDGASPHDGRDDVAPSRPSGRPVTRGRRPRGSVIDAQTAEIVLMRQWLRDWDLRPGARSRHLVT